MSDILTIDTSVGITKEKPVERLPLFDDKLPMLSQEVPEYNLPLPNPQMSELIQRMKLTMKENGGLGLSATQCGVFQRVFVIGFKDFAITCINPKIIKASEKLEKDDEGCLSFPGLMIKINRPASIDVEFTTESGEVKQMNLTGVTARCFQHELDHLNGIKFTEKVGPTTLMMARKKQAKLIKKIERLTNKL